MSLIEPVILIVMGVVVVTILIALYLPIFSLSAGGVAGQYWGLDGSGARNCEPASKIA